MAFSAGSCESLQANESIHSIKFYGGLVWSLSRTWKDTVDLSPSPQPWERKSSVPPAERQLHLSSLLCSPALLRAGN